MNRNDWNPPTPVASETIVAAFLGLVVGAAALFVWVVSPSLVRGATRSYELSLQDRRAEIDRVVASRTESNVTREDVNE